MSARVTSASGGCARLVLNRGIEAAGKVLDPGVLTLGFARRFASYKRPTLLLHDQERVCSVFLFLKSNTGPCS